MRNFLYATTGIALALAVAGVATPVMADVDVRATITKNKDINITQNITITKTIEISVEVTFEVEGGAEAQALVNVVNGADDGPGNSVDGQDINPTDNLGIEYGINLDASIDTGSISNNSGVWGFNQDVGNMTNQGNVVSVAGIDSGTGGTDVLDSFAQSQAHVEQENAGNEVTEHEVLRHAVTGNPIDLNNAAQVGDPDNFAANKTATIDASVNLNDGIINVNQNAGNMNNQTNAVAAAVGIGAEFALSEADLGQETSNNTVLEVATVKVDSINGSINNNSGIVNVNQSTGNMNNQGNVVSLSAILSGAEIVTTPGPL